VRDAAGAVSGLLVLPVDLRVLNERLMHAIAPQAQALVVDRQNRLLLQSGSSALAAHALPCLYQISQHITSNY